MASAAFGYISDSSCDEWFDFDYVPENRDAEDPEAPWQWCVSEKGCFLPSYDLPNQSLPTTPATEPEVPTEPAFTPLAHALPTDPPEDHDDPDSLYGVSFTRILKIVKGLLASLLEVIIDRDLQKNVAVCAVNHPSQRCHSCLFEADYGYFNRRFEEIIVKIHVPWLKFLVSKALHQLNFFLPMNKIQKLIEDCLIEPRPEPYIKEKLQQLQQDLDERNQEVVNKITRSFYHRNFTEPQAPLTYYGAFDFEDGETHDSNAE
ncbi:UNVERIFIED_CONTAM: hypothetical protein FKN15_016379 [Acipenser sinensis]